MNLRFVKPSIEHEEKARKAVRECVEVDGGMEACSGLDCYIDEEGYEAWLEKLEKDVIDPDPDWVPHVTFFLIEDKDIVGIVNIRLELNDLLLNHGGHIGYGIQPNYRNKGKARKALELSLEYCYNKGIDRVLVTCDESNIASKRVIEKCGGIYEDTRNLRGSNILRFWFEKDRLMKEGFRT